MVDVMKGICIIMVMLTHVTTIPTATRKLILYPFTILPAVPMFLMLSGFVFTMTECAKLKNPDDPYDVGSWFEKETFFRRFNRFLIPYLIADVLICVFLVLLCNVRWFRFETLWKIFVFGGRGPGGYYILLLFQFLILFPFMLYGFKKQPLAFSLFTVSFW